MIQSFWCIIEMGEARLGIGREWGNLTQLYLIIHVALAISRFWQLQKIGNLLPILFYMLKCKVFYNCIYWSYRKDCWCFVSLVQELAKKKDLNKLRMIWDLLIISVRGFLVAATSKRYRTNSNIQIIDHKLMIAAFCLWPLLDCFYLSEPIFMDGCQMYHYSYPNAIVEQWERS